MKRSSSSIDFSFPLNNHNMQMAWGFVLYGADGEHKGVQPEIAQRVRLCCKDIFNYRDIDSENYWERSFKKYIKYNFRIFPSWRDEYVKIVGETKVATRNLAESRKAHIENLGKYCDHFPDLEDMRSLLKPFAKDISKKDKVHKHLNQVQEDGIIHKREEISLDEVKRSQSEYIQKLVAWCYMLYHHWDVSMHGMIYDAIYPFHEYLLDEKANPDAQFLLGYCYVNGHGVEENNDKGGKYLLLAENQKHPLTLIYMVETGYYTLDDGTEDPELTFEFMESAADLGNPIAQGRLSDFYLYGRGTNKDLHQALRHAQMSASQGDANGLYRLAGAYLWGELDVKQDMKLGFECMKRAADLGHMKAQYYWSGLIKEVDPHEAFKYAKSAADQGFNKARDYVHKCYTEGLGTKVDPEMALKYAS